MQEHGSVGDTLPPLYYTMSFNDRTYNRVRADTLLKWFNELCKYDGDNALFKNACGFSRGHQGKKAFFKRQMIATYHQHHELVNRLGKFLTFYRKQLEGIGFDDHWALKEWHPQEQVCYGNTVNTTGNAVNNEQ